jgi:hypothetical protein
MSLTATNKAMQKNIDSRNKYTAEVAARIKKTAILTGYSERTVQRVIYCDVKNDEVLSVYMELQNLENTAFDILLNEVKRIVPFN